MRIEEAIVKLDHHPETDSILLGYQVATFKTEDYEGDITASGKTLRIHVKGIDGFVDIDIRPAVSEAVAVLTDGNFESLKVDK